MFALDSEHNFVRSLICTCKLVFFFLNELTASEGTLYRGNGDILLIFLLIAK